MLGPGEVALLTDTEIELEIQGFLRPDETFELRPLHRFHPTYSGWCVEIRQAPCLTLWRNTGLDPHILLLDAYGWLWARLNPTTSHLWTSRKQELPRPPPAWQETSSVPDPEDLDPSEVDAVYGKK